MMRAGDDAAAIAACCRGARGRARIVPSHVLDRGPPAVRRSGPQGRLHGPGPGHPDDCACSAVGCAALPAAWAVAVYGMTAWAAVPTYILFGPYENWWDGIGVAGLAGLGALLLTCALGDRVLGRLCGTRGGGGNS